MFYLQMVLVQFVCQWSRYFSELRKEYLRFILINIPLHIYTWGHLQGVWPCTSSDSIQWTQYQCHCHPSVFPTGVAWCVTKNLGPYKYIFEQSDSITNSKNDHPEWLFYYAMMSHEQFQDAMILQWRLTLPNKMIFTLGSTVYFTIQLLDPKMLPRYLTLFRWELDDQSGGIEHRNARSRSFRSLCRGFRRALSCDPFARVQSQNDSCLKLRSTKPFCQLQG